MLWEGRQRPAIQTHSGLQTLSSEQWEPVKGFKDGDDQILNGRGADRTGGERKWMQRVT